MRTIRFVNPRDNVLHVETALGIVNIRVGLTDNEGRRVEAVTIIPNNYPGDSVVELDGFTHSRMIEQGGDR